MKHALLPLLLLLADSSRGAEQAAAYFQRAFDAIRRGEFAQAEADARAGLKIDARSSAGDGRCADTATAKNSNTSGSI